MFLLACQLVVLQFIGDIDKVLCHSIVDKFGVLNYECP